ncbi:MAG TPA: DUF5069 domain-containing protein [Candidatus Methylacidiphilales bacterium]|jgi:hypothetical protein|nr:DUF5069 domain-containing protein [Candidatus Methylacidiphilales bacterium]
MNIVPTISSASSGPLGVLHLPRLWQKVILKEKGLLPADYDFCGKGFDQMVIDGLGLDKEETLAYLKTIPTYFAFEKWVLGKKGGKLDAAAVEKLNAAIRGYNHSDETRKGILTAAGVEDTGKVKDAVTLNMYEDWGEFQKSLK